MAEDSTAPRAPSSQTSSHSQNHLRQKRARSQLSCTPCRQGKLKCNRDHPACDQCIKRNRDGQCVYVPPPVKNKPTQNVKGRIRQLESLVVDLMNKQSGGGGRGGSDSVTTSGGQEDGSTATSPEDGGVGGRRERMVYEEPTPPSDNDGSPVGLQRSHTPELGVERPFGKMKVSKDEISYHGASHWQSILNSISDLKRDLGDEDEGAEDGTIEEALHQPPVVKNHGDMPDLCSGGVHAATTGLGFFMGNASAISKEDLLKAVPEKRVADRLLSLWFNSPDPFKPIIHGPTFQDEYRRFWRNPSSMPVMWLGLLFSILSLAESFGLRDCDPHSAPAQACLARVNKYHGLASSAAVLADFTKPKRYTVECLILYGAGMRSNNAFMNIWLMIGLVLRIALRMGYHRDSSMYPEISPFQGEMRRRVWCGMSMIDVLISFQLGLPSMVRTIATDTQPPRNLLDRDFNEDTKVLPPGRPIEELTPSSYTRAKVSIVKIFAEATELSHATQLVDHAEVMRLDNELELAKAAVPPLLQMPDISELVTDPAEQLMCRFNLDLLHLKTKIVLHRRYMLVPLVQLTMAEQIRGIGESRMICVECACKVLKHHQTIYAASQVGGQLESVKWYMGSISTHDFLLAAMVVCLELSQQMREDRVLVLSGGFECPKRQYMINSLQQSQAIWAASSLRTRADRRGQKENSDVWERGEHMYSETEKASKAMGVMLERVKAHFESQKARPPPPTEAQVDAAISQANTYQGPGLTPSGIDITDPTTNVPFKGVMPNFQWNSALPQDPTQANNTLFTDDILATQPEPALYNPFTSSTSASEYTPPSFDNFGPQLDYSKIGDMIDVPLTMDWNTWDDTVIRGDQMDMDVNPLDKGMDEPLSFSQSFTAGNMLFPDGTGPVPQMQGNGNGNGGGNGDMGTGMFMWEDLQDVNLDIRDYGSGGLWGTTLPK